MANLSPTTRKLEEVDKCTKKLGDIMNESNSENEKNQELVPIEVKVDFSENEDIESNIKTLPNSKKVSIPKMATLGFQWKIANLQNNHKVSLVEQTLREFLFLH